MGGLTRPATFGALAPNRGPAIERAIADAPDSLVSWSLALVPVSTLVMAGLLVLVLARCVAIPAVPPTTESSLEEALDLGMPRADEANAWVLTLGPEYTR